MIDDNSKLTAPLRQNIQNYAIGKIKDRAVRADFCKKFDLMEVEPSLDRIARASTSKAQSAARKTSANRYDKAFCIIMDDGKKGVGKVMLPKSLLNSKLFRTGVIIEESE